MATKSCVWKALKRAIGVVINSKAEVIMLFFTLAYFMPPAFIQNLIIQKLCLQKNYPRDYCLSNAINETLEENMQGEAAQLLLYYYLIRQLPAIILALFIGQWCDKYGRKYVMIIASVGCSISALLYFVNAIFINWPPVYVVVAVLPAGLSGGFSTFQLGLVGYIRDVHPVKALSVRIATVFGVDCLTQQIGPLIGGQLYLRFGAEGVFLMCAAMLIVGIVFIAIFVKDEKFKKGMAIGVVLRDFFDGRGFLSSVVAVCKKRDGHFRAYIFCVLGAMFLNIMSLYGFIEILFLYTRLTVEWDVSQLNFYNGLIGGASAIGSVILLPLMVQVFHWPDSALGLIGLMTTVIYYYILAFAKKSVVYYGAVSLQAFSMFCSISFRSIITKCVSFTELGKVMAVYAVVQSCSYNVGQIAATQVYVHTYRFYPGSVMLFLGSIGLVCVVLYLWIFVDLKMKRVVLEEADVDQDESHSIDEI